MARNRLITRLAAVVVTSCCLASGELIDGASYDNPTAGPPAEWFAAASTLPASKLAAAAAAATSAADDAFQLRDDNCATATIYNDWADFESGAAFVWVADMDVDCDGIDYTCTGNQDGQDQTNFGALAAYEVPWIVIPDSFVNQYSSELAGNNVAAVICNGKILYGIFGDSDGDSPEVIGEASWLMARSCFPDDDLNGNNGHGEADVTYIVFLGDNAVLPSSALTENYLQDFDTLRSIGDGLLSSLAENLGISLS